MPPGRLDCGALRVTNRTPHETPEQQLEKWAKVAFEISYHTQLLRQVSAESVDHQFWPLEHLLRQGHLTSLRSDCVLQICWTDSLINIVWILKSKTGKLTNRWTQLKIKWSSTYDEISLCSALRCHARNVFVLAPFQTVCTYGALLW